MTKHLEDRRLPAASCRKLQYTLVLEGMLKVESRTGVVEVRAGQAVIAHRGEWVRYSSPGPDGADYVAVCVPAFAPDTVHREA
jgi:mannose-6-phosphate isomerase-like protein (cupin superfamily)